jgi:hypothetical protein
VIQSGCHYRIQTTFLSYFLYYHYIASQIRPEAVHFSRPLSGRRSRFGPSLRIPSLLFSIPQLVAVSCFLPRSKLFRLTIIHRLQTAMTSLVFARPACYRSSSHVLRLPPPPTPLSAPFHFAPKGFLTLSTLFLCHTKPFSQLGSALVSLAIRF